MNLERASGILLHPTSLPGPGGVGTLGAAARRFVDQLQRAGQTWWQILPLNPPGHGGSPYSATSAFAGNSMLIDLDGLVRQGWITGDERESTKEAILAQAAHKWRQQGGQELPEYQQFVADHDERWLDDFALFSAIKDAHDGASWRQWPKDLVRREPKALAAAREELGDPIADVKFTQWQFFEQWHDLRDYAADRGIRFLGDLPIFVAMDSAEVWANRRFFELDEDGEPDAVAGVPPDYFSETGQRWGNPLYDWQALADDGYRWWIERVEQVMETVDLVRVDHFRGFEAFWRVPAEEETAINGQWVDGPKDAIFEAIRDELGQVPFVAEDLGTITDEVYELRDRQGLPGMKVLHFAFDGNPDHPFLPHTYPERAVAYTGTHDNDTTRGWYEKLSEDEKHRVRTYLSRPDEEIVWALIERLWESNAALTIVPAQDLWELGSEARMNIPGEAEGNWDWRMTEEQLGDDETFMQLGRLTEAVGR